MAAVDPLSRLAHQARRGEPHALDAFVAATYDQVWRLCASLVGRQGADDLAQETFVRAVRSMSSYRGDSSARTWLLAIARHACLDELRARTRRRGRDAALAAVVRPTVAGDASGEPTVADLVERLDPDRRTAFVLTQVIGLSYDEAAQVSDCPVGTIRSRVARARRDLLGYLATDESARRAGGSSLA